MKNYLVIYLLILFIEGCCGSGSYDANTSTSSISLFYYLKLDSSTDTIYSITYPNSKLALQPKSNISKIYLSDANEQTTLFINSSLGFDTIIVQRNYNLEYIETTQCSNAMVKKDLSDPNIIYHTFNFCSVKISSPIFIGGAIADFYKYEKYDSLIAK